MSLGEMVPGSEMAPDWRAVAVGAVVLGALCMVPVLQGWLALPGTQTDGPLGAAVVESEEGPGILESSLPLLIGAPGPFVAGVVARRDNLKGAVEGMLSVSVGAGVLTAGALVDQFLLLEGMGLAWRVELLWRGVGAYAVIGVFFVPFVCMLGAALGWVGRLVRDVAGNGVRVAWS